MHCNISLTDMLSALGLPSAFSEETEFSEKDWIRDLLIDDAYRKAYVEVDERGTEAAAQTGGYHGKDNSPTDAGGSPLDVPHPRPPDRRDPLPRSRAQPGLVIAEFD